MKWYKIVCGQGLFLNNIQVHFFFAVLFPGESSTWGYDILISKSLAEMAYHTNTLIEGQWIIINILTW